jgi:hypothetical protein
LRKLAFVCLLSPVSCLLLVSCIRPRYAHYTVDRFAFSKGTAHASGWLDPSPDPPVTRLSQVADGQRLVIAFSDFDRGLSFEAILVRRAGVLEMLVLEAGQPAAATPEQRTLVAPLLDIDPALLIPMPDAAAYGREREELLRAVSADPGRGLETLAAHPSVLFASDARQLVSAAMSHSKATAAVLRTLVDLAAKRRETGPALRGWIRSGGAGRLLETLPGERACDRDVALALAADVFAGAVRCDRELVLRSVLRRPDLSPSDLRSILDAALKSAAPSSERRGTAREVVRHAAADADVLRAAVASLDALAFSADRRQLLAAVLETAKEEAVVLDVVAAGLAKLDYDGDREAVLVAAARHGSAGDATRQAIRAGLGAIVADGPRARVAAALEK